MPSELKPTTRERLAARFVKMFSCDTARIASYTEKHFLILGWNRNTRQDEGQWLKNGEPIHFDYVSEQCVASGATVAALIRSARRYKKLLGMSWENVLKNQEALNAD